MACLEALPAEVLYEIAEWLVWDFKPPSDGRKFRGPSYARHHAALARSCRRLYSILNPQLYKRNIQHDAVLNSCVLWAAARGLLGTIKIAHGLGADLDLLGPQSRDFRAKGWNGIGAPRGDASTPLHVAVENDHLDIVEYLLEHGAAVHLSADGCCLCHYHVGAYALHMALRHSKKPKETATMLIRHGAYLVSGNTPAAGIVSRMGHHDLFQLLVEQGRPESTKAALDHSLRSRNLPLLQDLLRRPDLDLSPPPSSYPSLLGLAVYMGLTDAVRALLSRPDVDPTNLHESEHSPLQEAAQGGHVGALHALLTMRPGIDVNATDDKGRSPFHHAADYGHVEVLKALTQYPDVKVDVRDKDGQTPLHLAAYGGKYDAVRFLIKHPGVQPLAVDAAGLNVLHCLAIGNLMRRKLEQLKEEDDDDDDNDDGYYWSNDLGHGYYYDFKDEHESSSKSSNEGDEDKNKEASPDADEVKEAEQTIRELISIGIPIDQEAPTSETALRIAIRRLNFPMAIALLACGCDHTIGFEEPSGWTLLHECLKLPCRKLPAKQSMQTELVKQLVGRGVNIEAAYSYDPDFILMDMEERHMLVNECATPFYCAAALAHNTGSMEVLLEAGADPNAEIYRFGRYSEPLLTALYPKLRYNPRQPFSVFGVLVKHGAKLDEAGGEGKTALEAAIDCPKAAKEMLLHATSENICREHVQSVIDDLSSRKKSRNGLELLGDLKDFRDRVFGGE
ncbi:ankyrin 2,3/unc44 [Metarhizium brunneum]